MFVQTDLRSRTSTFDKIRHRLPSASHQASRYVNMSELCHYCKWRWRRNVDVGAAEGPHNYGVLELFGVNLQCERSIGVYWMYTGIRLTCVTLVRCSIVLQIRGQVLATEIASWHFRNFSPNMTIRPGTTTCISGDQARGTLVLLG
jgi:hypothetical protein